MKCEKCHKPPRRTHSNIWWCDRWTIVMAIPALLFPVGAGIKVTGFLYIILHFVASLVRVEISQCGFTKINIDGFNARAILIGERTLKMCTLLAYCWNSWTLKYILQNISIFVFSSKWGWLLSFRYSIRLYPIKVFKPRAMTSLRAFWGVEIHYICRNVTWVLSRLKLPTKGLF